MKTGGAGNEESISRAEAYSNTFLAICVFAEILTTPSFAFGFSDVSRSDGEVAAYFDAINWVSDNGYMTGTSSTNFSPNMLITRGMTIFVIWCYSGRPEPVTWYNPFSDVDSSMYFYKAVLWGVENGITAGTTPTTFAPNTIVKREQLMAFLWRCAQLYHANDVYYYDDISTSQDYGDIFVGLLDAMRWAVSNGILIREYSWSMLYPNGQIKRKELALYLNRYSCNVDGIVPAKDQFQFANSSSCFQSGQDENKIYMITSVHFARLNSGLQTSLYLDLRDAIREYHLKEWGGSCYGMSEICILDKLGKIGYNEYLANDCSSIYQIPNLRSYTNYKHYPVLDNYKLNYFTKAESAINYYQLSYQLFLFDTTIIPSNGGRFNNNSLQINQFIADMLHCSLTLMNVFWNTTDDDGNTVEVGHSIVLYGHPYARSYGYRYCVYDPAFPEMIAYLDVYTASHSFTLSSWPNIQIKRAEYIQRFEFTNAFDVDGENNNLG